MNNRPEIVAEIAASHNGSLERALKTIEAASCAGADTVKFQTFNAETMVADTNYVLQAGPWKGENLHNLYSRAATPWEWHKQLFAHANRMGLKVIGTPFDESAVDFLESIGCERYKIASFELTDIPLIRRVAATKKPMIISTGMGTLAEISVAVSEAKRSQREVTILKCTSAYPTPIEQVNLAGMDYLRNYFTDCKVGLSDHTRGYAAAVGAAVLGATMIEKHIHLDDEGGLDDAFAATPSEFVHMVAVVREAVAAVGIINIGTVDAERFQNSMELRRSLYARTDIAAGDTITQENVYLRRPFAGIPAGQYYQAIGMRALRPILARQPVQWRHLLGDKQ